VLLHLLQKNEYWCCFFIIEYGAIGDEGISGDAVVKKIGDSHISATDFLF
jgi:hypothetical protein